MMSINAVKGVEIGAGFGAARFRGEENADEMRVGNDGQPVFLSNNAGGILGGISTGQPIVARFAVKPTSSILTPVKGVTRSGEDVELVTKGRHDPCVGIRAVPVGEAMLAIVLADHFLRHRAQTGADVGTDMDFSPFDTRRYVTLAVREGYREWAGPTRRGPGRDHSACSNGSHRRLARRAARARPRLRHRPDRRVAESAGVRAARRRGFHARDAARDCEAIYERLLLADVLDTRLPPSSYDLVIRRSPTSTCRLPPLYTKRRGCVRRRRLHHRRLPLPFPHERRATHFNGRDGEPRAVESHVHLLSDHTGGLRRRLALTEMDESIVDDAWIRQEAEWEPGTIRSASDGVAEGPAAAT